MFRYLLTGSFNKFLFLAAGGVIEVNDWDASMAARDITPPEQIRDFRVLNAAADGNNIFTLGWTAPSNDLNKDPGLLL